MHSGLNTQRRQFTKILVRGVNWLGDAVMCTPALLRLREAHPEARISILIPEKLKDLYSNHPALDAVLTYARDENAWSIARRLRKEDFQLGMVFPNSFRSALEVWLARIPERIGYRSQWRSWLFTQSVGARPGAVAMHKRSAGEVRDLINSNAPPIKFHFSQSAHHLHHYLHLVSCVGGSVEPLPPRLMIGNDEVQAFMHRWNIEASPDRPLFGLNPGAEYGPAKRWPAERFISAAIEIQKRMNCCWLLFGSEADINLASNIAAQIEQALRLNSQLSTLNSESPFVFNLAGRTTLRELCAGLKACRLLLTNDTGPMHVAAAVGTRVIALFGSTSLQLTGPGLPGVEEHCLLKSDVPCSPCFLRRCPIDFRCMTGISVEQVVQASTADLGTGRM